MIFVGFIVLFAAGVGNMVAQTLAALGVPFVSGIFIGLLIGLVVLKITSHEIARIVEK